MKRGFDQRKAAILLAASSIALLSGCGSGASNSVGGAPAPVAPGIYAGGCIPLQQASQITFTATNAFVQSNWIIKAGSLPVNPFALQNVPETVGSVILNGVGGYYPQQQAQPYGQLGYGQQVVPISGVSRYTGSQIQLNMTPLAPVTGAPYTGPVNIQGTFSLGMVQNYLGMMSMNNMSMNGFPYPAAMPGYQTYPANPNGMPYQYAPGYMPGQYPQGVPGSTCVSGLAFRLERVPGANTLGFGGVFLYMNGQPHGISVAF